MDDKIQQVIANALNLNGTILHRVNDTIFIPLPRGLWRDSGGCCCRYCSAEDRKSEPAYWDTLAVSAKPPTKGKNDYAWTVHYPKLHGAKPKRDA